MLEALDDVSVFAVTTITARATPPQLARAAATACSSAVHAMAAARASRHPKRCGHLIDNLCGMVCSTVARVALRAPPRRQRAPR